MQWSRFVMGKRKPKEVVIISNSHLFLDWLDNVFTFYSDKLILRIARKIIVKLNIVNVDPIFYGGWKKHITRKECRLVIMFDSHIRDYNKIVHFVRNNTKAKIVLWRWNLVELNKTNIDSRLFDEIWTYSRFDAKKYKLKYNSQFYYKLPSLNNDKHKFDLVFIGKDKDRGEILSRIKKIAETANLKCFFNIVNSKEDRIDYIDYLNYIASSKCIVDIVPSQLCGLTLRPLEALFYKKKLITDYKDIVNYDFYDKQNIFVVGIDDFKGLAEFMKAPYKEIDKKIVDYYSFYNWLDRIEKGESAKNE